MAKRASRAPGAGGVAGLEAAVLIESTELEEAVIIHSVNSVINDVVRHAVIIVCLLHNIMVYYMV